MIVRPSMVIFLINQLINFENFQPLAQTDGQVDKKMGGWAYEQIETYIEGNKFSNILWGFRFKKKWDF